MVAAPSRHRSQHTKEEVLGYLQPDVDRAALSPSQTRPMSAGARVKGHKRPQAQRVQNKNSSATLMSHHPQLFDRQAIEAQLGEQLRQMNQMQISLFEQVRTYLGQSHEVASNVQLENQELRAQIAELRKSIEDEETSTSKSTELLGKHHIQANRLLVQKDAEVREAKAESAALWEQLKALEKDTNGDMYVAAPQSHMERPCTPAGLPGLIDESAIELRPSSAGHGRGSQKHTSKRKSSADGNLLDEMRLPGQIYAPGSFLKEDSSSSEDEAVNGTQVNRPKVNRRKSMNVLDMKHRMETMFRSNRESAALMYHETGIAQAIVKHPYFEGLSMTLIALNVVWIGIDAAHNPADVLVEASPVFIVVENVFCTLFTVELLIRFAAYRSQRRALKDPSFLFDAALVFAMVIETWIMFSIMLVTGTKIDFFDPSVIRMLRLLRLSRVARVVRILRSLPELMILVKAIGIAARSVFFTMCLLLMVNYVFAIAFTHMAKDTWTGKKHFDGLTDSMFTLFWYGCFGNDGLASIANDLYIESYFLGMLLLLYLLLAPFTVIHLLLSILVHVVGVMAGKEQESMDAQYMSQQIRSLLSDEALEEDRITPAEFKGMLQNNDAVVIFQEVGVDLLILADTEVVFEGDAQLNFNDFIRRILLLRTSNTATLKDIIECRKALVNEINETLGSQLEDINKGMTKAAKRAKKPAYR